MSVSENIKNLRKQRNMTQKQLAAQTGLAVITIQQYEAGKYVPKIEALKKIAVALECEVSDIDESIYIIPSYKPTTEKMEWYKLEAEVTQIYEKAQTGKELTSKEQQKIIDYEKQFKSQASKREEAAKKAPRAFIIENGKSVEADRPIKFTSPSRSHAQAEAYELFHSLLSEEWTMSQEQEVTAVQLKKILGAYDRLNTAGRTEAVKRVDELTELPRYTRPDAPPQS